MFLKNVLTLLSDEKDLSAVAEVTGNVKYILTALFTSLTDLYTFHFAAVHQQLF